ncbi:nuclear transport factor 2 family protein [Desulfopila aestuarii]|uniref:SnoaL-like domain-containing protein n=1 Tax=Desulfopila aestuarii DSM 18488 TaxID=1121416 RepID=A0A1M7XY12_9BACT|nr:nuclear transport factor 2 family protein [Desulfopila aestuarii]SHO43888.1 SnoaL-like domain-containing protein [Desulfopila aestuarii DSM 18488]
MSHTTELEKRIQRIEDLEAIKNLHRTYIYHVNAQEWDDVLDCITEDGTVDLALHGSHTGSAELAELFKVKVAKVNEKWNGGHFVTQPVITVDGDKASGFWMLYIIVFDAETVVGPTLRWIQGRHDCEYVKQDGRWKIKYVKFSRPWPEPPKG